MLGNAKEHSNGGQMGGARRLASQQRELNIWMGYPMREQGDSYSW